MKGRIKYLFLIILVLAFFFPRPASADFFGIVDLITASLEGVEETASPVVWVLITIFLTYIVGIASAFSSALLLQYATQNPDWLSITSNDMVRSGWYFTSGLANIFIILILVFIAFAYILKIESFQAKKTLPKLIIVALLMNFSLVFVGIVVDIANFFYNTVLQGNMNLPLDIVVKIGGGAWGIILGLITTIGGLTICFMTPLASTICQAGVVFGLIAVTFLPSILTFLLQAFLFFLISGIFFTYAFLFGARVFIIELLAILAPIAFLCSVLPQTKKYWDEWLQHLVQWSSFGIILFLFLTIGLKAANFITPPPMGGGLLMPPIFSWIFLPQYIIYYFFLFVYLVVALWLSRKFMPTLASLLIEQGKALGGMLWARGIKPLAGATWRQALLSAAGQEAREKEAERRMEAGEKLGLRERMGLTVGKGIATPARWVSRLTKVTPELAASREIEAREKELEEKFGKDTKSAVAIHTIAGKLVAPPEEKAALALYLQKMYGADEKGLGRLSPEQFKEALLITAASTPHKVEDLVKHRQELIGGEDKEMSEAIRRSMFSKGFGADEEGEFKDKDLRLMADLGVKIDGQEVGELITTPEGQEKVMKKVLHKKATDALKTKDIETLTRETRDNEEFQEAAARWKEWSFIRELGETHPGMLDRMQDKAEKIAPTVKESLIELAKTNPSFVRAPYTAAGRLLMREWEGIGEGRAKTLITEARKKVPPTAAPPELFELSPEEIEARKGEFAKPEYSSALAGRIGESQKRIEEINIESGALGRKRSELRLKGVKLSSEELTELSNVSARIDALDRERQSLNTQRENLERKRRIIIEEVKKFKKKRG